MQAAAILYATAKVGNYFSTLGLAYTGRQTCSQHFFHYQFSTHAVCYYCAAVALVLLTICCLYAYSCCPTLLLAQDL